MKMRGTSIPRLLALAGLLVALVHGVAAPVAAQSSGLSEVLLRLEDLPSGWSHASTTVSEVIEDIADDGFCERDGITFRPAALAVAAFDQRSQSRPAGGDIFDADGPTVLHVVADFAPAEASRAFGCLRDELVDDFGSPALGGSRLDLPLYGDERVALRVEEGVDDVAALLDIVMVRRGALISILLYIDIGTAGRPADPELILRLAAIADLRLANALKK